MMKLLQEKDQQIREQQQQIDTLSTSMRKLLQEKDQQIREQQQQQIDTLQMKVKCLENLTASVTKFTMTEFQRHRINKTFWSSPSFYTHSGGLGYKIYNLGVHPHASHVAVWMNVAKGDYDDQLQWPRACTTTIQLLNQLGDHNHFTKTVEGVLKRPAVITNLVWSDNHFIAHSDLGYKADTSTQYLKNDCLQFKIVSFDLK